MPRAALAMAVLASVVPCLVAAQQSTGHRIGQLGPGPAGCAFAPSDAAKGTPYEGQPLHPFEVAFRLGLRDSGWTDPDNLHIERRCYQTVDQLATMAEDLAGLRLEAIIAFTTSAMLILKQKGGRVPIVFIDALDPVGTGFVTSLARPGGNMTGLSGMFGELVAKRIELLRELVPGIKRLGLLSDDPIYAKIMADAADGGRPFNITTHPYFAERPDDLPKAFAAAHEAGEQAMVIGGAGTLYVARQRLAELASKYAIPVSCTVSEYVDAGCLMSYAPDLAVLSRRAASYVDRILRGGNPSELPVEQPTKFELVINLKTAKALGLTVPANFLARADRVIEGD
jgi:putative tryptophan/tyrosine transport system substrate-binding protein